MKKLNLILLLLPLISACSPVINDDNNHNDDSNNNEDVKKEVKDLTIYSLNDSHGDLLRDPDANSNGLDGILYEMNKDKVDKDVKESLFICTGDMFQGQFVSNVTRGKAVIDALNYMNLDAFILGNHEFDWSLEEIHKFKDGDQSNGELNAPILCANLLQKSINDRPSWVDPYVVLETDTHKVGVIGLMGEGLESSILSSMVEDYSFTPILPEITKYTNKLRGELGCDTVIVGIHDYNEYVFNDISNLDVNVDAIFGGHTHQNKLGDYVRKDNKTIYSIQSGANNSGLSAINFKYDQDKNYLNSVPYRLTNKSYGTNLDEGLKNHIETKYQKEIRDSNEVIHQDLRPLDKNGWGNLILNALCEGVDGALINKGGVRNNTSYQTTTTLYAKKLFRILPFDNKIYEVKFKTSDFTSYMHKLSQYNYYDLINSNKEYVTIRVIDYVFDGVYDRDLWDKGTLLNTLDLNIREFVTNYIKTL